jgi:hypothetical protein
MSRRHDKQLVIEQRRYRYISAAVSANNDEIIEALHGVP